MDEGAVQVDVPRGHLRRCGGHPAAAARGGEALRPHPRGLQEDHGRDAEEPERRSRRARRGQPPSRRSARPASSTSSTSARSPLRLPRHQAFTRPSRASSSSRTTSCSQVLGTSDPTSIQEHMLKLFDNTARSTFDRATRRGARHGLVREGAFTFETIAAVEGAVENVDGRRSSRDGHLAAPDHQGGCLRVRQRGPRRLAQGEPRHGRTRGSQIWWTWETRGRLPPRRRRQQDGHEGTSR